MVATDLALCESYSCGKTVLLEVGWFGFLEAEPEKGFCAVGGQQKHEESGGGGEKLSKEGAPGGD